MRVSEASFYKPWWCNLISGLRDSTCSSFVLIVCFVAILINGVYRLYDLSFF
jgi:hypothetical protein